MNVLHWRPGLTVDLDPDSKILYTIDMTNWFGANADILSYQLIPEEPLAVTYHARNSMLISFKVSNAVQGKRLGVTLRITVDGPVEQQDDRTVYFRGQHQ